MTSSLFYLIVRSIQRSCPLLQSRQVKALFGVSKTVCELVWNIPFKHCSRDRPGHLLWVLYFFKSYTTKTVALSLLDCSEKCLRKWLWIVVTKLADIETVSSYLQQINFNHILSVNSLKHFKVNFLRCGFWDATQVVCTMTIIDTDCSILEHSSMRSIGSSRKRNDAGIRYEVGVRIYSCFYWIYVPYPFGHILTW